MNRLRTFANNMREVVLETIWPTRCAICDMQGKSVLCRSCEENLVIIDDLAACPRCGAPYGRIQCTECNDLSLASMGLEQLPFEHMSHSVILDDEAKRVVSVYKDQDERRLADDIARILSRKVSPDIGRDSFCISYIPDTERAFRRRGFDHAQELASKLADICGLECVRILQRPSSADQRELGRLGRIENMLSSMQVDPNATIPQSVLLVDDVRTTGATVYSACIALKEAGVGRIRVLTFGIVME